MANTITVGRMTFTSPRRIDENSVQTGNRNSLDREISISGSLCGSGDGAAFIASSKKLRDELISMGNSNLLLPFTYEGDTTMKGYCKVVGVSVGYVKLATGYFSYDLTLEVKGRPSEMFFESNMSGSLLTNSHSITTGSTTYGPFHAVPVNTINYKHSSRPTAVVRATDEGNVSLFYANDLRDNAANWIVEPENFYKGASKVTIDSVVKTGYLTRNLPTGVELSNGIVKVTSGSTTDQSRFTLSFYDNGTYGSSREIAISRGSAETEWNVWQTVQIMRNEPQEVAVRFTTYSEDSYGDGRLTVDVTLRRGAHHASFVISEGGTSARATNSRKNVKLVTANTITNSTGYAIESSVDTDGQKFLFGSPQGYTADTTNRLIHISSDQFKVFAGYEYNSASPENHDTADAVRDQYLEGLYENVRLVRA
tara:strand:- start:2839 stop:4110 length:1272 start_codon:yes stop_codon:yes gene_type:complete